MSKEIYYVVAWDHFSTDDPEEMSCKVSFIGELVQENKNYIKLRHINADINNPESAEEYHVIFKKAIIYQKLFEISQQE